MARRAAKVDGNHVEIVEGLRAIGASVESLAQVGNGCVDLLVGYRGANILLEVKIPGEKLNNVQRAWHNDWRGKAHVVWSLTEALTIVTYYGKLVTEAETKAFVAKHWPAVAA